ncbi:hypothetical protein CYLTODRAFT_477006 [Cylindrobasidium torrendii FP15055 ss-10]|uniref:Uncharacterized protein n=1 Tax=Cylindrobasidium torrendii FP15055 ss-10 TaxID=1314674 RepID=A0A0D7AV98_9AGAR|nr:hypothetical protein CYLTODRAFT_477006 [Cylindrobasidium torrendii FP15055 ss-10]
MDNSTQATSAQAAHATQSLVSALLPARLRQVTSPTVESSPSVHQPGEAQSCRLFATFMRQALRLLTGNPNNQVLPEAAAALERLDYYLPFRELAPSRRQILSSPNGPFSATNVRTPSGLFSALVFRGILFDTDALRAGGHSFCFDDDAAFDAYLSRIAKPERYFCNPSAYGATKGRSTKNATTFWKASAALAARLQDNIGFFEFIKYVSSSTEYPTFGKLCAYLLAVDLVYAGAIAQPTVEELGTVVEWLDMGAAKTLKRLRCAPGGVKGGFVALCKYLADGGLSASERAEMSSRFTFDVEHGLCKYGRFYPLAKDS